MLSNPTVNLSVSKAEFRIVEKIKKIVITFCVPSYKRFILFFHPFPFHFHPRNLTPIMEQSYEGKTPRYGWRFFSLRRMQIFVLTAVRLFERKTFKPSGLVKGEIVQLLWTNDDERQTSRDENWNEALIICQMNGNKTIN